MLGLSVFAVFGSGVAGFPGSGGLCTLVLAFLAGLGWGKDKVPTSTFPGIYFQSTRWRIFLKFWPSLLSRKVHLLYNQSTKFYCRCFIGAQVVAVGHTWLKSSVCCLSEGTRGGGGGLGLGRVSASAVRADRSWDSHIRVGGICSWWDEQTNWHNVIIVNNSNMALWIWIAQKEKQNKTKRSTTL